MSVIRDSTPRDRRYPAQRHNIMRQICRYERQVCLRHDLFIETVARRLTVVRHSTLISSCYNWLFAEKSRYARQYCPRHDIISGVPGTKRFVQYFPTGTDQAFDRKTIMYAINLHIACMIEIELTRSNLDNSYAFYFFNVPGRIRVLLWRSKPGELT
jgi:hypothetical protein